MNLGKKDSWKAAAVAAVFCCVAGAGAADLGNELGRRLPRAQEAQRPLRQILICRAATPYLFTIINYLLPIICAAQRRIHGAVPVSTGIVRPE